MNRLSSSSNDGSQLALGRTRRGDARARRRVIVLCATLGVAAFGLGAPRAQSTRPSDANQRWVTTWATAQQLAPTTVAFGGREQAPPPPAQARIPATIADQTIRMIARASIGGSRVRIRLSNALEKRPLQVGAAHIAVRSSGSSIVSATDRTLTFGGRPSTVVPPGTVVLSDPVELIVPALADLAITLYLPTDTGAPTVHPDGLHTAYLAKGNVAGSATLDVAATTTAYLWLSAVDVLAPATASTIVAFGDSITDGMGTTPDADRAWASLLAARLSATPAAPLGVANVGLSGNRLLRHGFGVSALARFDRDVLGLAGARWMIVLLGINDITFSAVPGMPPTEAVTAEDLIWGFKQIIERAHVHGIRVAGATILPIEGVATYTESGEAIRQAVNQWIRTSGAYDAVIDFDAAVRDPANPKRLRADFDPGDRVHPNDAGNAAMAAAIDVSVFRR
jgi:lysophospholipase L1-like esterase